MKKILLSSLVLLVFSLSLVIFQISCAKPSLANNKDDCNDSNPADMLYLETDFNTGVTSLHTVSLNGTVDTRINVALPQGWSLVNYSTARLNRGNNKIIFTAYSEDETTAYHYAFFSCSLNGNNVQKIKEGPANSLLQIEQLY